MAMPGETGALTAGVAVLVTSLAAVVGPLVGIPPWTIALAAGGLLAALTADAALFSGRGGHLLAETLPGGTRRLRRIALHEAAHGLVANAEAVPVRRVLVGTWAALRAGVSSGGCTEFDLPAKAKMSLTDLRRWSRVLLAGMVAEELIYGESIGGADDRAQLGRLWGLSGHDVATAQREQRQARREVKRWLGERRQELEERAETLLRVAPRLGRS
ncbi:MAG: hypothetical protein FJ083_10990 [Cyanobacteria bacterium K_Offshore_surface_m2_239]|nr:hypothetical protein [Cyanobacteria bacterium K_Offshore_surface_m2_239]